jgi:dienelactone hydrolase
MKKWRVIVLLLLALGGSVYWLVAIPARAQPGGVASIARFVPGPYDVIADNFEAVDNKRPTPANHAYPGQPRRELKGTLWRPAELKQPGPLLVYSHGFMSFHGEGEYLARFLAGHGYTVVAVDYPLTYYFAPGKPKIADVVNQPGDVSFLIDTLLQRTQDKNDVLYHTIDANKIAVAGVSLGGLTTTLVTFHRKVRDPRIAAAISIAGPGVLFPAEFFAGSTTPFMMIAGTADVMLPYARHAADIPKKYPGSILVTLQQGSHAGFAMPATTFLRFASNPDVFGCKALLNILGTGPRENFLGELNDEQYHVSNTFTEPPCAGVVPATAMPAARQHLFTTLAAHAFLESVLASDEETRQRARTYLRQTLSAENPADVAVAIHP